MLNPGSASKILTRRQRSPGYVGLMLIPAVVSGCAVPRHTHVTQGVDPRLSETDVRFPTSCYFRTFDYCGNRDAAASCGGSGPVMSYRNIVPSTDTVYRFRMTGKAPGQAREVEWSLIMADGLINRFAAADQDETSLANVLGRLSARFQAVQPTQSTVRGIAAGLIAALPTSQIACSQMWSDATSARL